MKNVIFSLRIKKNCELLIEIKNAIFSENNTLVSVTYFIVYGTTYLIPLIKIVVVKTKFQQTKQNLYCRQSL